MALLKDEVLAKLAAVPTPDGAPLTESGKLSDVLVTDGKVFCSITVDAAKVKAWESVRAKAESAVRELPGVRSAMIALTAERASGGGGEVARSQRPAAAPSRSGAVPAGAAPGPAPGPSPRAGIPGVSAIIAVASGKGGVGKSTIAVNLALGLRDLGLKVGILDADIYGPSLPKLLAIRERPQTAGGNRLKPIVRHGMPVMSIGFLVEEETPMIWRGPMVMSALTQMLREVDWGTLDVMVVDMPPGTGDAQLTMAQQVPLKGAVIVSTPQDLALADARRGIAMFGASTCRCSALSRTCRPSSVRIAGSAPTFSAMAGRGAKQSGCPCRFWAKCRWRSTSGKHPTPARRSSRQSPRERTRKFSATLPRVCARGWTRKAGRHRRSSSRLERFRRSAGQEIPKPFGSRSRDLFPAHEFPARAT